MLFRSKPVRYAKVERSDSQLPGDIAAIETMAEKRSLLSRASAEAAWILLEHDPSIAWARPQPDGDDFSWVESVPATPTTQTR